MISPVQRSADELEARMIVQALAAQWSTRSKFGGDEMCADPLYLMGRGAPVAFDRRDAPVAALFELKQNYPNPFNPSTTITFEIARRHAEDVSLVIFDVLGRRVRTLVEDTLSPGQYSYVWNGQDDTGSPVASGLYLYRLQVDDQAATRSMTLI